MWIGSEGGRLRGMRLLYSRRRIDIFRAFGFFRLVI